MSDGTLIGSNFPSPVPPPWLFPAGLEIGVKEMAGDANNSRILEYHKTVKGLHTSDSVPWCSSFVNWCLKQCDIRGTNSAVAKKWLTWGEPLETPRFGCVTVLWRGMRSAVGGHVGFFLWKDHATVYLLGGNQWNQVCVKGYNLARVLDYRWKDPKK